MPFRDRQVDELLAQREKFDRGEITEAELIQTVRESTGNELDAAMREYGGYDKWGH